jgi:hypothetical protein
MNTDIRIKTSFPNHPKTLRLIDMAGEMAPWCLVKLWLFAGQNRPNGILKGMSQDDICKVSGWSKDPSLFITSLLGCGYKIGCGYLNQTKKGTFVIHGWKEHNAYCFNSPLRVAAAKKGASARWQKKNCSTKNVCGSHETALPIASNSNAPSPVPSPSPTPAPTPALGEARTGALVSINRNVSGQSVDAMGRKLKTFR